MVFYTIAGAIIGFIIAYVLCGTCGVSFKGGAWRMPSEAGVVIFVATLLGGGVGFGYGLSAVATGTHVAVNALKHH